jgi:GMP synthase-like glutamine amidotransferase
VERTVMKVHVLQHMPNEGLGSIEAWLAGHGASVSFTRFWERADLPAVEGIDLVIALGGPMSVNDEATLPWLVAEKQFLRDAMQQGVAVLGICLGAQLIASALGARVYPNTHKEIGWFPVTGVDVGDGCFRFPSAIDVFHWHGETFELPPGAVQLARSVACAQQAFQIGNNIIGLQFHLETDPASARAFVEADNAEPPDRRELVPGKPYIQSAEQILAAPPERYAGINALMAAVLGCLLLR